MSRVEARFSAGKQLIPYVMAGLPDISTSAAIISELVRVGCRVIEIGIPYSDPLADGPTIQKAAETALEAGVTTDDVFAMISGLSRELDFSPVLMVYYNLVYRYGPEQFTRKAAAAGVQGLIIPDLSVEEAREFKRIAAAHDIDTIFLAAPTSSDERIERIAKASSGFIYCVSVTGVTGARRELPATLVGFLDKVRSHTPLPVVVGFGISSADQVSQLVGFADGVVVGSALVDLVQRAESGPDAVKAVGDLAGDLIKALNGAV